MSVTTLDAFVFPKIFYRNQKGCFLFKIHALYRLYINQFLFWFFLIHRFISASCAHSWHHCIEKNKKIIGNKNLTFSPGLNSAWLIQGKRSTAPPTTHRFYTRSKARAIANENAAWFEQMEQTTQKLKEMLLKNHEKHREQMASLMEIVLQMTKRESSYWRLNPNRGSY